VAFSYFACKRGVLILLAEYGWGCCFIRLQTPPAIAEIRCRVWFLLHIFRLKLSALRKNQDSRLLDGGRRDDERIFTAAKKKQRSLFGQQYTAPSKI
jgi:hypothetical protein